MDDWDEATKAAVEHIKYVRSQGIGFMEFAEDGLGLDKNRLKSWDEVTDYLGALWMGLRH